MIKNEQKSKKCNKGSIDSPLLLLFLVFLSILASLLLYIFLYNIDPYMDEIFHPPIKVKYKYIHDNKIDRSTSSISS
jgi:hypothetical protein